MAFHGVLFRVGMLPSAPRGLLRLVMQFVDGCSQQHLVMDGAS
jgi:hypothetical protein